MFKQAIITYFKALRWENLKKINRHVNALVGIKILVPTAFGTLLLLLWKVLFDRRWIEVIALVFVFLSVEIGASIKAKGKKYTALNYFNFSISALVFIFMVGVENIDYKLYGAGMYVYPVMGIGVLMILNILIFVKHYKGYAENICDYEKMFQISRKA